MPAFEYKNGCCENVFETSTARSFFVTTDIRILTMTMKILDLFTLINLGSWILGRQVLVSLNCKNAFRKINPRENPKFASKYFSFCRHLVL